MYLDTAITRAFPLYKRSTRIFQAVGLTVTNHVQFGGLGTSLASPQSFGTISGQNNGSRDLQLAAKINF